MRRGFHSSSNDGNPSLLNSHLRSLSFHLNAVPQKITSQSTQPEISVGMLNYYELLELFQQKVKTWSPAWELKLEPLPSCWSCMPYVQLLHLCRATCMVSHTIHLFNLPRFVYGVAKASGPRAFCLLCFLN